MDWGFSLPLLFFRFLSRTRFTLVSLVLLVSPSDAEKGGNRGREKHVVWSSHSSQQDLNERTDLVCEMSTSWSSLSLSLFPSCSLLPFILTQSPCGSIWYSIHGTGWESTTPHRRPKDPGCDTTIEGDRQRERREWESKVLRILSRREEESGVEKSFTGWEV